MRIRNRPIASLSAAALLLGAACLVAHRYGSPPTGRVGGAADPGALAAARVEEQYRASARAASPSYDVTVLVGSGAPGSRDGSGLYAQLADPVDISLSAETSRLLILDDGGRSVREVLVDTRQVSTMASAAVLPGSVKPASFARVIAAPGGAFLVDESQRGLLFLSRDGRPQVIRPAQGAPEWISDLVFDRGRLLVLDGPGGRLVALTPGAWTWSPVAAFPPGAFDRFCVDGASVVVLSSAGGRWQRVRLADQQPAGTNPGIGPVGQILWDRVLDRYIAWGQGGAFTVPRAHFNPAPVPIVLSNMEGRLLGDPHAAYGYATTWLSGASRVAFDADRNVFYVLDRAERRVLRVLNSFVSWRYGPRAGNSRGFLSPEYPSTKPAGTTRILWLSHSVFWDPAGLEEGNLAVGAPRIFERVLNERWPDAGRWEVLNPGLTGMDFYTSAYSRTVGALQKYGLDHVVLVMDLYNLLWTLQFSGVKVPAAFNKAGVPDGVDAAQAGKPFLAIEYPPELAPLTDYIRKRMVGTNSAAPLMDETGGMLPFRFVPDWVGDPTFRSLLLDAYVRLLKGVQKACADAGVAFTVLVAPVSSFVSPRDWVDTNAMGTGNDFEAAHRPLLERLWREAIPAYDLTYDMLGRHPQLFPFNAPSHHRSNLFHRAVAESAQAVADRFNLFPRTPQPARISSTGAAPRPTAASEAIVTEHGDVCFMLLDLWRTGRQGGVDPTFAELLGLAAGELTAAVERGEYACRSYRVTFANVKNRDDYGNRDLRAFEEVATMTIPVDRLPEITKAVAARAVDTPSMRTEVDYRPRRNEPRD